MALNDQSPYQGVGAPKVVLRNVAGQETANAPSEQTTACDTAQRLVSRIPWLPIRATTAWSCSP